MFQSFNPKNVIQTPFLFLTGKGGVGKTSTASAAAVALADSGKKVLLISTDPASNLQDVFGISLTNTPIAVPGVENLFASNLDPEASANAYRDKVVGPYKGKLPDSVVATMEEQLSGACTVEIAAFDEFSNLLTNVDIVNQYDHIIFDTAPTGHTLRLLQLPTAWSGFLEESTHGASCLGPLSGLADKKDLYSKTVEVLSNPSKTTLILVTRPDASSLLEADRASSELKEIGVKNQILIVNGLLQTHLEEDEVSSAFYYRQRNALQHIPEHLKQVAVYSLPFVSFSLTGIDNLRYLFKQYTIPSKMMTYDDETANLPRLNEMITDFSSNNTKLIFTMGKGGVGKTTIASAIAVGLVEKGHCVHLTTTDPAGHLNYQFENDQFNQNLTISSINPKEEVEKYKADVLKNAGQDLDEEGLAYLEEDLNSPCTEEIAVFRAFAEVVAKSENEMVVIDTAPTGHTLLLLDAAQSYSKEIAKSTGEVPESVKKLLPQIRNAEETSVVIVTLAEATPVLEASRLQDDLRRANINPQWWVINQSLYATNTADPVLSGKAMAEKEWIHEVKEKSSEKCVIIPWMHEEKVGYEKLRDYSN
ncbi:arsenical pump-driving ATPase [Peribacillus frigoritolerans]|uniref:arsenical pump-driving ATPase n=1 Tax=Peribacillus frigoritolerans TaxID=450367 RepID=UPI0024C1A82F|nr:arsenical pump-driving ATPase [Peribacillus frigoritolerans]MDM5310658.1 arsenical pump-driving ATPase [Peribacillus frigoritolerans]WHX62948.1 arsenical pump-driving ATPase [Peribacillus frigoritolerans]